MTASGTVRQRAGRYQQEEMGEKRGSTVGLPGLWWLYFSIEDRCAVRGGVSDRVDQQQGRRLGTGTCHRGGRTIHRQPGLGYNASLIR